MPDKDTGVPNLDLQAAQTTVCHTKHSSKPHSLPKQLYISSNKTTLAQTKPYLLKVPPPLGVILFQTTTMMKTFFLLETVWDSKCLQISSFSMALLLVCLSDVSTCFSIFIQMCFFSERRAGLLSILIIHFINDIGNV